MPDSEKPSHRQAVDQARARAHQRDAERAASRARAKLRYMSVLTGLGLCVGLLGGFMGVYLADGGLPGYGTGSSVAIRLIEDGTGSGTADNGGARIALGEVTRFELAVPGPDESPAVDRRAVLGAALAAPADAAPADAAPADAAPADAAPADATLAGRGREESLAEATEAALARLYEEPLETAAEPAPKTAERLGAGALRQAMLPVPPGPEIITASRPAWQRFAVPVANFGARPMIAVVLDDLARQHLTGRGQTRRGDHPLQKSH